MKIAIQERKDGRFLVTGQLEFGEKHYADRDGLFRSSLYSFGSLKEAEKVFQKIVESTEGRKILRTVKEIEI